MNLVNVLIVKHLLKSQESLGYFNNSTLEKNIKSILIYSFEEAIFKKVKIGLLGL